MKALIEKLETWEKTTTKREKLLIAFVFILLPLFLFYKFYYVQTKEKIDILKGDIERLNLELKKYENLAEKERILETQIRQRKEFLNRLKEILPSEKEIPGILKQIALLAKENNLEVVTFEPSEEIPQDYYNIIPIKMEIKGNFGSILRFLNSVESLPRLVVLENIKFQVKDARLSAVTTFHTFKYTGSLSSNKTKSSKETKAGEKI